MHTNDPFRVPGNDDSLMPNPVAAPVPARFDTVRNEFIPHPSQFPVRCRRRGLMPWLNRNAERSEETGGDVGLSFHAAKYIPAGTRIEIEIPLRGETQRLAGTVVMVRELADGYEIGLWLASPNDATRARIVEQICHTECYLRARRAHHS